MQIIRQAIANQSEQPPENQIVLAAARREFLKRRWRGTAADGAEFGFDLESRLTDGCVIHREGEADYIIRQLPEIVYEIPVESPAQAALVGWKVGNLHLPAQISDDAIRVLHDEATARLLEREGWPFSEVEVLFTPMKAIAHAP